MLERQGTTDFSGTYQLFVETVQALCAEQRWDIDRADQHGYATVLARLHPTGCPAAILRRVVLNYHHDHRLVQALCDHGHQQHQDIWNDWMSQSIAVLRRAGLDWHSDTASDIEDLAQVARLELVRALPEFRYESRFSTWAFAVCVQSVRYELRARNAQKRSAQVISLELPVAQAVASPEANHPEVLAAAVSLLKLASSILDAQPDRRLTQIFYLWAVEDRRVVEIGEQVGLGQARVRFLLQHIVDLLKHDVRMQAWLTDPERLNGDRA